MPYIIVFKGDPREMLCCEFYIEKDHLRLLAKDWFSNILMQLFNLKVILSNILPIKM